jgi:hypothetical protein
MERVARHSVSHGAQSPDERLPREKGRLAPFLLAGVQGQSPAGGAGGKAPAGGAGAAPRSLPTAAPHSHRPIYPPDYPDEPPRGFPVANSCSVSPTTDSMYRITSLLGLGSWNSTRSSMSARPMA